MVKWKLDRNHAVSALEYTMLLVIILSALLVAQKYIVRAMAGRWKEVGDSFGVGRQYDPKKTIECVWSEEQNTWYGAGCFKDMFNSAYSSCRTACYSKFKLLGICGGASGCNRNSSCCDSECSQACTSTVISMCTTVNGIPCNE